jgi:hypothetical protein
LERMVEVAVAWFFAKAKRRREVIRLMVKGR